MKRLIVYFAAAALAGSAGYALQNNFNAQPVSLNQLPAPAQKAITQHSGGSQPSSITAETFNGWTTYKVMFGNNSSKPMRVDAQGHLLGEQWRTIPPAVEQTADARIGQNAVEAYNKTEINGQPVYHFRYNQNGQPAQIWIGQGGNIVRAAGAANMAEGAGVTTPQPATTTTEGTATEGNWRGRHHGGANATTQLSAASKVSFDQLPQAVQNSINSQANGAAIEDIDKGTLNGHTVYEAAFKRKGQTYELRVREDGKVLGGHFD
jgi:hypothetical protein